MTKHLTGIAGLVLVVLGDLILLEITGPSIELLFASLFILFGGILVSEAEC